PNIVQVHDLAEPTPGSFCIVMEYVAGESAEQALARGPLPMVVAVNIACQALDGLSYAHQRGVVHRDVKEANLLLGADPWGRTVVKVADFGLAKNYHESGASGFTGDGTVAGTLPYMAREQLLDFRYVKPTADIYSMGVTLYRLLTGRYPRD